LGTQYKNDSLDNLHEDDCGSQVHSRKKQWLVVMMLCVAYDFFSTAFFSMTFFMPDSRHSLSSLGACFLHITSSMAGPLRYMGLPIALFEITLKPQVRAHKQIRYDFYFPLPYHPLIAENPAKWLHKPRFTLQALSLSRSLMWWITAAFDSLICLIISMWWWSPSLEAEGGLFLSFWRHLLSSSIL